ncbi:MAG: deoxyhypusine synthase [Thermoplasmata archaeon HGW-Thermoplasmata-1]|nr:MAG: deoxyhypusine synthase [Thermoplasmata archaeon HGW-Thermoplasmata-1]
MEPAKRAVVKDIKLEAGMSLDSLVREMHESGGFTAKKLAVGVNILEAMQKDDACKKILSFPSSIMATGTRGVVKELVKNKMVDVIITTCGTVAHDLCQLWKHYYHGDFLLDDAELHRHGVNRLGNVLIPNEAYGELLEGKLQPMFAEMWGTGKTKWSTRELMREVGLRLRGESNCEESVLYWAAKNEIPVYIPGPTDGAFGCQLWMFYQEHRDFVIDLLADEQELSDLMWTAQSLGALMIGGGISKHHTIWWSQFRDGLDYAVYLTSAPEWDGSLSGAPVREAVSWGKVKEDAKYVTIEGDATINLPLMIGALLERL